MTEAEASSAGRREVVGVAAALLVLTATILFLSDGMVLLTRPLWVDEVIAALIASRPSPVAVIGDLGNGADGGASLFHLGLWSVRAITGSLAPVLLRLLALSCMLAALLLTYVVLRRGFPKVPAVAGMLAIGTNALVIEHSYDARFYGPWLLGCVLLAWLLSGRQRRPSRGNAVALAVVAFAVCTIHFYGIITLTLMVAGAVASGGSEWRRRVPAVRPAAWGLLALPIIIPLAFAQRRAYTVPSWLPDFAWHQLTGLLGEFWLARIPLAAAFIIFVAGMAHTFRPYGALSLRFLPVVARDAGIAAIAALALIPLALGCLSLLGQPSMLSRYAIASVLVWGPWIAIATTLVGRWAGRAVVVLLVWFWFVGYTREAGVKTAFTRSVAESRAAYDLAAASPSPMPIVFASTHVMYPVLWPRGLSDSRAAFLDVDDPTYARLFPDSTRLGQANRVVVLERDLARVHSRRLGFPRLATRVELDSVAAWLFVAPFGRLPAGFLSEEHYGKTMFPGHAVRRLERGLLLLTRPVVPPTPK